MSVKGGCQSSETDSGDHDSSSAIVSLIDRGFVFCNRPGHLPRSLGKCCPAMDYRGSEVSARHD